MIFLNQNSQKYDRFQKVDMSLDCSSDEEMQLAWCIYITIVDSLLWSLDSSKA